MKPITISGEAAETLLQPLLGVCKQNPLFSLHCDKAGDRLLLFYGAELLESFPSSPHHFALRLCAGRLYNVGVPRKALKSAFGLDVRTIRRVAEALKQDDPEVLTGVLQGRQRPRKLTAEISAFIDAMCDTAFDLHPEAPSRHLRDKVREVFAVSLSAETIRPLLADSIKSPQRRIARGLHHRLDLASCPTRGWRSSCRGWRVWRNATRRMETSCGI